MWYVWWRYNSGNKSSAWHDAPRHYKTEKAARMAERDLNVPYVKNNYGIEHVALAEGIHPNTIGEPHESTRT
jgi:hypothetical protein